MRHFIAFTLLCSGLSAAAATQYPNADRALAALWPDATPTQRERLIVALGEVNADPTVSPNRVLVRQAMVAAEAMRSGVESDVESEAQLRKLLVHLIRGLKVSDKNRATIEELRVTSGLTSAGLSLVLALGSTIAATANLLVENGAYTEVIFPISFATCAYAVANIGYLAALREGRADRFLFPGVTPVKNALERRRGRLMFYSALRQSLRPDGTADPAVDEQVGLATIRRIWSEAERRATCEAILADAGPSAA